jgi:hypothetical protein
MCLGRSSRQVQSGRKIVDYAAANKRYYPPVDLDDPLLLANDGLDPTESDPRFHKRWSMRALPELSRFRDGTGT